MFLIVPLGVDTIDMPHGSGNICLGRLQKHVIVLCEVPDYVKLNSPISCPPLYFLHLFSNLLHIIGVPWQANSTIVRHWVSAMEEVF